MWLLVVVEARRENPRARCKAQCHISFGLFFTMDKTRSGSSLQSSSLSTSSAILSDDALAPRQRRKIYPKVKIREIKRAKLLLCGSCKVGKTCLVRRFLSDRACKLSGNTTGSGAVDAAGSGAHQNTTYTIADRLSQSRGEYRLVCNRTLERKVAGE